ncbi:MAG: aspartate aminotransferase family protein, partial [Desulfobacterales bacterium]
MLERSSLRILEKALTKLDGGFTSLPEIGHEIDGERIEKVMLRVAEIMQDNYPYFHPYYAGQMLK